MPTRGCGTRKEGGLYLTVPMSPNGKPIDYFLIDPAVPWNGGQLRAPELFKLPGEETNHIIMGIGASFYPFVPDFVEEARVMGVSKRVPRNFDLTGLVPGESRLLLMHPKSIPMFGYAFLVDRTEIGLPEPLSFGPAIEKNEIQLHCPKLNIKRHLCVGDLWPLSVAQDEMSNDKHQIIKEEGPVGVQYNVKTPSTRYVALPAGTRMLTGVALATEEQFGYQAGVILKFPYFQFEFISKSGNIPRAVAEKFETSQFDLSVVPE